MKLNTGIMTVVTIGNETFEIDGYVKKSILEGFVSNRTILSLDFTNNLGKTPLVLSESNFIVNKNDETLEVEITDIDTEEHKTFSTYLRLAEAIESFMANVD